MAYQIIYKKRFYGKLASVLQYLKKEWNIDVTDEFLKKIDKRILTLKEQPFIGRPSETVKGVRGLLITRHNKLYYKISKNTIIILNLYDTRMNPKKNPYR